MIFILCSFSLFLYLLAPMQQTHKAQGKKVGFGVEFKTELPQMWVMFGNAGPQLGF